MSRKIDGEVEKFKRGLLAARLAQCTQKQRDFFDKVYPKGVPEASLVSAIDLCDRTIAKNAADQSRPQETP